jgi:hypothetical protein
MNKEPLWWLTKDGDEYALELYENHYSKRKYADGRIVRLFVDLDKRSSCEHGNVMPCLCGESSLTQADSKESTALSSETKASTSPVSLSDRLTPSLISAGLVCGTIPMSMRRKSNQPIQVPATKLLDGLSADSQRVDL